MEKTRKIILRVHGTLLLLVGVALTVNSTLGAYRGIGILKFLQENEFGLVGLFQAYLLMAILGIALWLGSVGADRKKWHAVGALAHLPPLAANIMFRNLFVEIGLGSLPVKSTSPLFRPNTLLPQAAGTRPDWQFCDSIR